VQTITDNTRTALAAQINTLWSRVICGISCRVVVNGFGTQQWGETALCGTNFGSFLLLLFYVSLAKDGHPRRLICLVCIVVVVLYVIVVG